YGMYLGVKQIRNRIENLMTELVGMNIDEESKKAFNYWLESKNDGLESACASEGVKKAISNIKGSDEKVSCLINQIKELEDYLVKRSQWILGGDGWAYDIGYGGLDHVLASGEDVNVLVFDTEIYSNTGGQASKSTPVAAMAKFAAAGKRTKKKDLGRMAMTYGNVYVAQVSLGADKNQLVKAIIEAENYNGPSLIICHAPCISHGLKEGMGRTIANEEQAVKCGYWHLYRFNPQLKDEGKNPFTLESKEPTESFRDFLMGQVRYSAIAKQFPDIAQELFDMTEENAKE
ncbi:thiamine pyrophosphate-dependent enzyme, partial [Listeria monocytogenes]